MRPRAARLWGAAVLLLAAAAALGGSQLPDRYFRLMEAGIAEVEQRLAGELPGETRALDTLVLGHYHPGALLVAAVLYAKQHPANPRYRDPRMLSLAARLGDLLATESETGRYTRRSDHHRDTYMWLEACTLLKEQLGGQREARWRRELEKLMRGLAVYVAERQDRPRYTSPFGVATNHTALQASTVHLAGRVFDNQEWARLGAKVMHRFAAEEQSADGYWGEHSPAGPTTAYDYLTAAGVALYWEHSRDPAALEALRRSTGFHKHYTYPDGQPVMILDDRRRHAYISPWAHFGFSHFPDGRRYAAFLTSFYCEGQLSMEHLGRIAQNALYFHEGPLAPIPQDQPSYWHQMTVPAGIRKAGPWVVCLSGLISTQAVTSRYYLDRQGSLSVFHEKLGLILTGANSKRQPELATFLEETQGRVYHMPLDSRLRMAAGGDRLSLAYNSFLADLEIAPPTARRLSFHFAVVGRGAAQRAGLTLQLCLKSGELLETASGQRVALGEKQILLEKLGGWIRHRGWTLKADRRARLAWPVYPYSPYAEGAEKGLEHAVGTLTVPLLPVQPGPGAARSRQEISFTLETTE